MIPALQEAYIKAVEKAAASVVNIGRSESWGGPPYRWSNRQGVGSGVVFDTGGHILTNQHVVDDADQVLVTVSDGRVLRASVVGGDEETDIAVLKVDEEALAPAEFGDSDALRVGQPVLAIGNPLGLAGGPTVTSGVVSALRRSLRRNYGDGLKVIQTDAAVNPGNSGGPLVDLEGRVIALTTATLPFAEGIGFAIPSNAALGVARQILEHGHVQRPWLGVAGYDVDRRVAAYYGITSRQGVFLAEVSSGSPAEAAGLQVGDVLTSLGGRALGGAADLVVGLRERAIGDTIDSQAERRGQALRVKAKLASRPF